MVPTDTLLLPGQLYRRLEWRYATKLFDPGRKIPAETWEVLEDALLLSPSSGGLQPWSFIVVKKPGTREKLLPAAFGQPQVRDASHLVVIAAKTNFGEADVDAHIAHTAKIRGVSVESLGGFRDMLIGAIVKGKDDPERRAWTARQATIALGVLLASAAALGIDACPMEGFIPAQVDAELGLTKDGLTAIALCALGYRSPEDKYASVPKVRFPKEQVIRYA